MIYIAAANLTPAAPPAAGTSATLWAQAEAAAQASTVFTCMSTRPWDIRKDDLSGNETRDLVRAHLEGMHAHSPPGSVFALDLSGLTAPNVTVWTVWREDTITGIGALKDLGARRGELKSMRTHPDFLRRGVAGALLEHIIREARSRGMVRLSLETGSGPYFDAALSLYRRRGFVDGSAFADYRQSPFNRFLHLTL
ncbi:MAG: GNAT family N-acetyltransferase [Steroidobacteraceae bacterium]